MVYRDSKAAAYISLTNRYIVASEFVKHGDDWIAQETLRRTLDIVGVPGELHQEYIRQITAWRSSVQVYLNEACRSLVHYDRNGDPKDLAEAEKFIRLVQE